MLWFIFSFLRSLSWYTQQCNRELGWSVCSTKTGPAGNRMLRQFCILWGLCGCLNSVPKILFPSFLLVNLYFSCQFNGFVFKEIFLDFPNNNSKTWTPHLPQWITFTVNNLITWLVVPHLSLSPGRAPGGQQYLSCSTLNPQRWAQCLAHERPPYWWLLHLANASIAYMKEQINHE